MELEFNLLYMLQELHNDWLNQVMIAITTLGNGGMIWIVSGLLFLFFPKTRQMGVAVLLSILVGFLLGNVLLKNIIARERPCWINPYISLLIESPKDYSFPSGHSLSSFAAAFSIFQYHKKWGIPAFVLAAAIACSRLYLFVHFPSDVIAGCLLGIGIAWIVKRAILCYDRKRSLSSRRKEE